MGLQANCRATYAGQTSEGKALLETDYVLFRGDFRLHIPFRDMNSVDVLGSELKIAFQGAAAGIASFELGAGMAEKWARKILNPPSRLDKLGVKPGMRISVLGISDATFGAELAARNADVSSKTRKDSAIVFYAAEKETDLERIDKLAASLTPDGALWVVYPKGIKAITENQVLAAGRRAGLVDVKVAAFSPTHTALKMVIPVAARVRK
jgi:hypothetical protein